MSNKKNNYFQLDLLILSALFRHDCYGYEIINMIKQETEGIFDLKEGTIYPILFDLVKKNLVSKYEKKIGGRTRVYYHIEEDGLKQYFKINNDFNRAVELVKQFVRGDKSNE